MTKSKKEPLKKVTVNMPESLTEAIDGLCGASFISRSAWIIQAAVERLEKEKMVKSKALIERLAQFPKE